MKSLYFNALSCVWLTLSFVGCQCATTGTLSSGAEEIPDSSTGASGGAGGDSETAGGGGAASTLETGSTSTSTTTSTEPEGPPGLTCGGVQGIPCTLTQYCDYPPSPGCGAASMTGKCRERPKLCPQDCEGSCGCDDQVYCNSCMAHSAGIDVEPTKGCVPAQDCGVLAQAISDRMAWSAPCTTIVRLDYKTRHIRSHRISCGTYKNVNESQARADAEASTGVGQGAKSLSGPAPADEYVFWRDPSDQGGASAVSVRAGATVLGASIAGDGTGQVTYPVAFLTADALGVGCTSLLAQPPARGFDLRDGKPLIHADVKAAMNAVWNSALPDGLTKKAAIYDAMVLLYAPEIDPFDPDAAEWVVLVNSGDAI